MQRAGFQALGLGHIYKAIDVPDVHELRGMVDAVRDGIFAGANVTVPYKRAVLELVDDIDPSASELGAANTLVCQGGRVIAYNTDAMGLADDLQALGAIGRTAAIIGSGGGASAALAACTRLGAGVIAVTSRSWTGSETLLESEVANKFRAGHALVCAWPSAPVDSLVASRFSEQTRLHWGEIAANADIIIQATSAGMSGGDRGEPIANIVPWERLRRDVLIYDLVYNPAETPFLRAARQVGLRATSGLGMLVRQGARAASLWLGQKADINVMRAAAESALQSRRR
jgi:shikimate dehydrogenase